MQRADSHFKIDESGNVKLVVNDSPLRLPRVHTDSYSPSTKSPLQERSSDDKSSAVSTDAGDFADENFVSIAQPLQQHGSVLLAKLHATKTSEASPSGHLSDSTQGGFPESPVTKVTRSESRAASHMPSTHIHNFLCTVPHLCTLPMDVIDTLKVMVREYDALDNVIDPDATLQHAYVLASGTVEVFDLRQQTRAVSHKRIASITAPNIFGIENIVFDKPSEFAYSASSINTTILLISKARFLDLFAKSRVFAHTVGARLTFSMPQFHFFQDFCRAVFAMSSVVADMSSSAAKCEGYTLRLPAILDSYRNLSTIIHPLLEKPEIDVQALQYACARLPSNFTETFVINLARSLPPFLANELRKNLDTSTNFSFSAPGAETGGNVTFVPTANRRRSSWRIGDKGHTLIMMRDGFTDVVDFMTNFCIHVIESRKLRVRLQSMISPSAAQVLNDAIVALKENPASPEEVAELQHHVLAQLPLTAAERAGLANVWPHSAIQKLYNIVMHQEQYIVRVDTSLSKRFNDESYFHWAIKIRSEIYRCLSLPETDPLPTTLDVFVLFSRNRCTKNLLCSQVDTHKEQVVRYHDSSIDIPSLAFPNERDRWYYTLFRMINEQDELRQEYKTTLKECGISMFEDYTSSGLQLDLIDVSRLKPELMDPYIRSAVGGAAASDKRRRFIVNVDFAFGAQAEAIVRAIFLTFGQRVRSVNVVGKCAGIRGCRGDILLPRKLVFSKAALGEDTTDEIRECGNQNLTSEMIKELLGDARQVRCGTCVTVPGMILQNEVTIKYYRIVHQADGMEMEGSYIARQLEECANLGLIRKDVHTRYIFFLSDMPLGNEDGSKLSGARAKSAESIATMYAAGRAMLKAMLTGD